MNSQTEKFISKLNTNDDTQTRDVYNELIKSVPEKNRLIINPPFQTMKEKEIDASFDLPYTRKPHPKYEGRGAIPAYEMIRFSVNIMRGCFGGCTRLYKCSYVYVR